MMAEWRLLLRTPGATWAALILLLLCISALYLGYEQVRILRQQISQAQQSHLQEMAHQRTRFSSGGDAGEVAYYVAHLVIDQPGVWRFLSPSNNRAPQVQRIRMLGIQGQLYDSENINPQRAISGAFDYVFVVVYLLPLFCIALCFDLRASESESGRLPLLQLMRRSRCRFWIQRVMVRWLLVVLMCIAPLLIGLALLMWTADLPATLQSVIEFMSITVGVLLYAAFWVALCFGLSLIWRQMRASTCAMASLVVWLTLCVIAPQLAHDVIAKAYPTSDAALIALAQRKAVGDAWDLPKSTTFARFFETHPEWKDTAPVLTRFHWKWYYAFHQVADESVEPLVLRYQFAMQRRLQVERNLAYLLPPLALQTVLARISQNDLQHRLEHQAKVKSFHTRLRRFFYPYCFNEVPFYSSDFDQMPRFADQ